MTRINYFQAGRMWDQAKRNPLPEIEWCENCDGTGVVTEPVFRDSDGYDERYHECEECDGTGRADDDTIEQRRSEAEEDNEEEEGEDDDE